MTDVPHLTVDTIIDPNGPAGIFGYAGYSSTEIIFAFRGTSSVENWLRDAEFFQMAYAGVPGAEVHYGFYQAYKTIAPVVRAAATKLRTMFPALPIIVTGHSLGAAISGFTALDLAEQGFQDVRGYSFGQPRMGNAVFAAHYATKVPFTWRVVNEHDIVPHIPPVNLGIAYYHHVPTELWFKNDTVHFVICDATGEDPTCADSLPFYEWIPREHELYLGFDVALGHTHGCGFVVG